MKKQVHPKVSAGAAAGAGTTFLVWLLAVFGVTMTAEAAAGLTVLLTLAAGYFTPA